MAGMLPGVECARRRRLHKCGVGVIGGGCSDSSSSSSSSSPSFVFHSTTTRRSSFCLYASNNDSRCSSSSSLQRSILYQPQPDETMVGAAREAKQRLDDKFRAKRVSENQRQERDIRGTMEGRRRGLETELQREIYYGSKKSGPATSRKFSWSKMSWKASEQEDCAVCLESFKIGETLTPLPCAHRFHSRCLKPWLENQSHCPCCRTTVL